jgi:membrane protease YdiL (CAAX protease family)
MPSVLEPSVRSSSPRWPIGSTGAIWLALALIAGHYVAVFGVGGALALLLGLEPGTVFQAPPAAFAVIVAIGLAETWLVLVVGMRRFARLGFREVGWRAPAIRDVGYFVLGLALCVAVVACIIAAQVGGLGEAIAYIVEKIASFTPQQRVFFVLMGIVAALPEETIFRGILQPTLQHKLGRWPGIVATAVIFAVYHFKFHPAQLAGKLGFGLIFGVLRERTGTLWAPAIAHALAWAVLGSI